MTRGITTRKPGHVGKERLRALRMVLERVNAPAIWGTHDERTRQPSPCAPAKPRCVIQELVDRRVDKTHELDFGDRSKSLGGDTDRRADDDGLRKRCVENSGRPKAIKKPLGDTEDPAVDTDILAEEEHPLVVGHASRQSQVQCLDDVELSPSSSASRMTSAR